jgi:hypothetical protein
VYSVHVYMNDRVSFNIRLVIHVDVVLQVKSDIFVVESDRQHRGIGARFT